jgi:FkbM family methyltransferase
LVDWRFIVHKYWNGIVNKLSAPDSTTKKNEDGLTIRYFRSASFPSPEEFNRVQWEMFDVALSMKGNVAVDIGAHVGAYALRLARNFRFVYAFEPNPLTFRVLSQNIRDNEIMNIEALEIAVSDTSGKKLMHTSTKFLPASTIADKHYDWLNLDAVAFPQCDSLDHYFRNGIGKIDLVKIDVENHELAVLQGMTRIIEKHHPVICCEVHRAPTTLTSCECPVCGYLRDIGLSVELHGCYTPEMEAHWVIAR